MKTETIAAIASAMTNSGIGIIRISGEDAFDVIDKIYRSQKGNKLLSQCKSHTIHYGHIYDEDEIIDEVMVLLMRAPNSYTREDTVEIDCHGGTLVMRRILEVVLKNGARPAEPGEFTKRAFLNGRIDLSQAESVMDVISSKNDFALKSSMQQLNGALTGKIKEIRSKIIHEIAFIESALDDPEHISIDGYGENLLIIIEKLMQKMNQMIASSENGSLLKEGINTVIVGKPNAGKSSILNILAGYDRAIVTDIAGTTRDTIEEQINLAGITLNLVDTAGIRNTKDIVEEIGVNKAKELVEEADLILYVVDSSTELDENDYNILNIIKNRKTVILLNKSDLDTVTDADRISKITDSKVISVSAKDNTGLDELSESIVKLFASGEIDYNDEVYVSGERNKEALEETLESLKLVKKSINEGLPEDFYTIDLMNAYEQLGKITGESVEDDLVNEIFSKFCMGK